MPKRITKAKSVTPIATHPIASTTKSSIGQLKMNFGSFIVGISFDIIARHVMTLFLERKWHGTNVRGALHFDHTTMRIVVDRLIFIVEIPTPRLPFGKRFEQMTPSKFSCTPRMPCSLAFHKLHSRPGSINASVFADLLDLTRRSNHDARYGTCRNRSCSGFNGSCPGYSARKEAGCRSGWLLDDIRLRSRERTSEPAG